MLLLLLVCWGEPTVQIEVDNQGRLLDRIEFGKVRVLEDGSFLGHTFHHVWHWAADGSLINQFGGRGEGPGEFVGIAEVRRTKDFYWVIDGARLQSSIFDDQGRYLYRQQTAYRQFVPAGDQLFVVDNAKLQPNVDGFPRMLQEIRYQISSTTLKIKETSLRFKKITPRQRQLSNNFKLAWVVRRGDDYWVVDQVSPRALIYTPSALAREAKTPYGEPFVPTEVKLRLSRWVDPPERLNTKFDSNQALLQWWHGWSRMVWFEAYGDDFVVAYEAPNPQDERSSITVVERVTVEGRRVGEPQVVDAVPVGARNGMLYTFREAPFEGRFRYVIEGYPLFKTGSAGPK